MTASLVSAVLWSSDIAGFMVDVLTDMFTAPYTAILERITQVRNRVQERSVSTQGQIEDQETRSHR